MVTDNKPSHQLPVIIIIIIIIIIILGQPITGPEIASLLSVLVDAANEGSLAEVG